LGVHVSSSSSDRVPRCWATHVGVGCPTLVFVIIGSRTSALGCPCRCGPPCLGVCVLSSSWSRVPWRWAAHVVVGCPTAVFDPLTVVGRRTSALSWGWRRAGVGCVSVGGEREKEECGPRLFVVAHFRDVPPTSHFPPPAPPSLRDFLRRVRP